MDKSNDKSIEIRSLLTKNAFGEEVVITGIGARLPECDNIEQFAQNLNNNVYMVTNDDRRWKRCYEDTPYSMGKIKYNEKLDAGFFDISYHQANYMDPQCRQLLERSVEAILDSGYSLSELQKTRTGVYVGHTLSDSEKILLYDKLDSPHFGFDGCSHSMLAQQISYHLKLSGTSINVDSACSSCLHGFEQAYRSIIMGVHDNAIVAGSHIVLNPILNQFFYKLGIVSLEGDTLVFNGNGYIRSEAVAVVFLQRAKDARRVYAEIVHIKTNVDGFKEEGLTFPSEEMISRVMEETFIECNRDPESLVVIEAHATGTKAGDPQELNAICKTLCKSRKSPLLIGSVKSSIGHTEPVSSVCSVLRIILGMNEDVIYPNCQIHYQKDLERAMLKRNLKIVTKTTAWPKNSSDLAAVSAYGFGGANGFVILKRLLKTKSHLGIPEDDLPRLVCFSGRNKKCLEPIFRDLTRRTLDREYIRLWHAIYRHDIPNHKARGFIILSKTGEIRKSSLDFEKTRLCFVFDKLNKNWRSVLKQLSQISLFKSNAEKAHKILGVNDFFGDVVGNVIVHAAIIDTLNDIGVTYNYIVGRSLGALSAAYADGSLSFEQVLLSAECIDHYMNGFQIKELNNNTSRDMSKLVKGLQKIILKPKPLNTKWILKSSDGYMSAEYIVSLLCGRCTFNFQNILNSAAFVTFGETTLEHNAPACINMLPQVTESKIIDHFLTGLGRIYQTGCNLKLDLLYPEVSFPVSRNTPSISPLIEWIHDEDWFLYRHGVTPSNSVQTFDFSLKEQDQDWVFLNGHVLDGECITPISGFIYMVWDTFSRMTGIMKAKMQVVFENVHMHKIINILEKKDKFVVRILRHSQKFEVERLGEVILSGKVTLGTAEMIDDSWVAPGGNILLEEDVYKQLRLRGYHYKDLFRGIKNYDVDNQTALIAWNQNWMAFIDNLIQVSLFHQNDKHLNLPTGIEKLSIDAVTFLKSTSDLNKVFVHKDVIKTEGIEVAKITTKSLKPQKRSSTEVLETYKFVPYAGKLSLKNALQVNVQLILENTASKKLKIVEVIDELFCDRLQSLLPTVQEILHNSIEVQAEVSVLSKVLKEIDDIQIFQKPLPKDESYDLLVMTNLLNKKMLGDALKSIKKSGFILTREDSFFNLTETDHNLVTMVSNYYCEKEHLVLLKKYSDYSVPKVITISNSDFSWVPQIQNLLKSNQKVLVLAENDPINGVLGFVNCLIREHRRPDKIKCVFIPKNTNHLKLTDENVHNQVKKDLVMNVFKDEVWGSYRNLALETEEIITTKNIALRNDLQWIAAPDCVGRNDSKILVYYASVFVENLRFSPHKRLVPMVEFSGIDKNGKQVMGFANEKPLTSTAQADCLLLWNVPRTWSLEQAATVPEAYLTAIYMLNMAAELKQGDNILLNCLPNTTIEAIVNIAKYNKCQVFITDQNRDNLCTLGNLYKNTSNVHVGNFNNVSFKKEICNRRKVRIIINASTNKSFYSLRNCLAPNGTFLQVTYCETPLLLKAFRNCKYIAVDLVSALQQDKIKSKLHSLLQNGLNTNVVAPINTPSINQQNITTVPQQSVKKVVVKIRDNQEQQIFGVQKFYCDAKQTYVIIGGLGGVGFEFIDWLIERGGQNFIVVARRSSVNGYQKFKINLWKSKNVDVRICTSDVSTEEGCLELLKFANSFGSVVGIFNLAAVTNDQLFENYSESTFAAPFPAKAFATDHLDKLSRSLCPMLKYFVVFSSFGASKGNIGQSNYNMANSIMERICESRKEDGYPALAIQWGALADVGLVTKMKNYQTNTLIGGTSQQSLQSCFKMMDRFLTQNETVVLCMHLPSCLETATSDYYQGIKNIIGIINLNTISHHVTLPQLGMDSVMSVEVQAYLENTHGLSLSISEIRNLTLAKYFFLISCIFY
ncbi:hypothetical protein RN001_011367 [Aquatica leii]|uniref:Fatty acid synthase n=1 Tax=Aquatica leii TaxID=1421715 RepID=A0AAN7PB18_9COLE|nr:hypothetical protein RN001_011367 [Aquatica leii]